MPRMARIVLANTPHHVVQRGHNKQVVFAEEEDYRTYLRTLREWKKVFGVKVYAYCLMTNHVHLLLEPGATVHSLSSAPVQSGVGRHSGTVFPTGSADVLHRPREFARLLGRQAASILQMALGRVGGILEAKKIAGMAAAHYAQIAPHLYCGPIEGAANIQLDTCTPNFLIQEGVEIWGGFHAEILKSPIRWEQGYIIPPTAPGIGVELDEEVAARHPYTGKALHLDMQQDPEY